MSPRRIAGPLFVFLLIAFAGTLVPEAAGQDRIEAEIDKMFAPWSKPGSPGGAVSVVRDGRILFAKGYGSANLEWDIPNRPDTVFCIGSVSKQFTAYCIALLEVQGKIRGEDDYRKYIPEMPDYGARITIDDIVHHSSGIRDDQMLFYLGDWERGELHTNRDVIDQILRRQKGLLFEPGTASDYSSANYALLAEIVRRVSGMSLREFARKNIFEPLGMNRTFFFDDFREVVPRRAWSYVRGPEGRYLAYVDTNDLVGAGGIYTTVGDMALWNGNFDDPKAGGSAVVGRALTPGRLRDGRETKYAYGLEIDTFRGLRVIKHDGSYGGYAAMFLRFPDERFAVFCAANVGDIDTRSMCFRIARLYLQDKMTDAAEERPAFLKPADGVLRKWAGDFLSETSADLLSLSVSGERLICLLNDGLKIEYAPVSADELRPVTPGYPVSLKLAAAGKNGLPRIDACQGGRVLQTYEKIVRAAPSVADLREIEGEYESEELSVRYRFEVTGGRLYVRFKRAPKSDLKPLQKDQFAAWALMFDFVRDDQGRIQGFRLGKIGPQGIYFVRRKGA